MGDLFQSCFLVDFFKHVGTWNSLEKSAKTFDLLKYASNYLGLRLSVPCRVVLPLVRIYKLMELAVPRAPCVSTELQKKHEKLLFDCKSKRNTRMYLNGCRDLHTFHVQG